MATDTTTPAKPEEPALNGKLIYYDRPEPLNKVVHAKLGLKTVDAPFAFMTRSHIIPVMVTEFAAAAVSYPVVFLSEPRRPVAVMGFSSDRNLFANEKFGVEPDIYLPLFARRYPFAFATDESSNQQLLVVDLASDLVGEDTDRPFFKNGEPTEVVQNAIKFCTDFEQTRMATDHFCNRLEELQLLEKRSVQLNPQNPDGSVGQTMTVAEYWAVSEDKLRALPADTLVELVHSGMMNRIYAHLTSLNCWDRLLAKALTQQAEEARAQAAKAN